MRLKILLAEDHAVVREGLKALLESRALEVVGLAADGGEAVRMCEKLRPDVALLDFSLPIMNGATAAKEIQRVSPQTKAIILSAHGEEPFVEEALRAGVKGYVLKAAAAGELITAIQEVWRGDMYLTPKLSGALAKAYLSKRERPFDPLTQREKQVLQLVAEGKTSKDIANQLVISVKTAECHRANLMEKLNIHEVAGLVRYALARGFVQLCLLYTLFADVVPDFADF